MSATTALPDWAQEAIDLYQSDAASQFILHGNVQDRVLLPLKSGVRLGSIDDFLNDVLLTSFNVVLSYDVGNGIRIERGGKTFQEWPSAKGGTPLPKKPREACQTLTHYLRYVTNLKRAGGSSISVAIIIRAAHLVAPAVQGTAQFDLNAIALLMRDWASETAVREHSIASFFITENLNDMHPLVANNPRTNHIRVPLPSPTELRRALQLLEPSCATALQEYEDNLKEPAEQLVGATLSSVESLLRQRQYENDPISADDLADLKKDLVERDCNGLIEFVESDRSLDDYYGQEAIKDWMRGDIALWQQGDLKAMPMGYLLCGPVGTGKTYLVECLAGDAGVPVVKLKNFRDRWVGSTEGNLEKIFRLLEALGRCIVFIDEADQALGKRDSGSGDSGLSGRVYSMMAKQMSDTRNRGKILWILASSRPDLIEIDLKRPGRIDIKLPIFPCADADEAFVILRALCKKQGIDLPKTEKDNLIHLMPDLLTPGAAEAIAVKIYRMIKTKGIGVAEATKEALSEYQPPIPVEILSYQIELAKAEATDLKFIPEKYRKVIEG